MATIRINEGMTVKDLVDYLKVHEFQQTKMILRTSTLLEDLE